jgi:hypothetical protein
MRSYLGRRRSGSDGDIVWRNEHDHVSSTDPADFAAGELVIGHSVEVESIYFVVVVLDVLIKLNEGNLPKQQ